MSSKTPKGFVFCTHPDVCGFRGKNPRIYAIKGLKVMYMNFHMFIGMVKETSMDKKWSNGSKESTEGKGKAIQM